MTSNSARPSHSVRPTIPLNLVSLRLPDTMDWIRKKPSDTDLSQGDRNILQLYPGQPGEVAVELANEGPHPILWSLEVVGNFPLSWHLHSVSEPSPALGGSEADESEVNGDASDENESNESGANESGANESGANANGAIADDDISDQNTTAIVNTGAYVIQDWIAGGDRQCRSLYLQIPSTFFEGQEVLSEQSTLTLDYRAEIFLFAHLSDERHLVGYQALEIQVRPESTYMTLLPEIFQSEDFMMRFLSIFEQTFDPSLQMLSSLWAYLDPLTAPRSMLPFLSKWVAWDLNPRWTLKQQRRLMRYAVELYRWRGTRRGLRYYLHLYTDLRLDDDRPESEKQIGITDDTRDAFAFGEAAFGQGMMGGGQPFNFRVVLRPDTAEECDRLDEEMIHQVIERVKPAFCTYRLEIIRPESSSESSDSEPDPEEAIASNVKQ